MSKLYLIAAFLVSTATLAQNLLPNGNFDTDVSGWELPDAGDSRRVVWVSSDGSDSLGSLEIGDNFNNGGNTSVTSVRIDVIGGKKYKLSASAKVIEESEARDAGFFVVFYNDIDFPILNTEVVAVFTTPHGQWYDVQTVVDAPADAVYAKVGIGVTTDNSGSNGYSIARWDDVRFELFSDDPEAFAMVAGHSALWYNPNENGHGFNLYMLPNERVVAFWYVYDTQGSPLWLIGIGSHDGFKATLDVTLNTGARFPPNFDANDVVTESWGTLEIEFSSCNNGKFKWNPAPGGVFTAGEVNVVRLTSTLGLFCND